jgi:hypothetical protein
MGPKKRETKALAVVAVAIAGPRCSDQSDVSLNDLMERISGERHEPVNAVKLINVPHRSDIRDFTSLSRVIAPDARSRAHYRVIQDLVDFKTGRRPPSAASKSIKVNSDISKTFLCGALR